MSFDLFETPTINFFRLHIIFLGAPADGCCCSLQDTQKGDITLALSWTSVELEAGSDLKPDSAKDDDDDDEPTPPSGGYHNGKEE